MATFRKRGNGWRVELCVGTTRESATYDTKAEAQAWADRRSTELRQLGGVVGVVTGETRLVDLLNDALETRPALARTRRTGKVEKYRIERLIENPIAGIVVNRLSESDFLAYVRGRRADGVSPSTIRRELGIIRKILNRLLETRQILVNPVIPVLRSLSRDRVVENILSTDDVNYFDYAHEVLNTKLTRSPWLVWAMRLAAEIGVRKAELVALRWSAVNFVGRSLTITEVDDIPDENGERTTEGTKNRDAMRVIPLSPEAIAILRAIPIAIDPELRDRIIPMSYNALNCAYRRLKKRAGANFRWHDLRHTAATNLLPRLSNLAHVAAVTGHKDLRSLQRYLHPKVETVADLLAQRPAKVR